MNFTHHPRHGKNFTGIGVVILLHLALLALMLSGSKLTVFRQHATEVDLVPTVDMPPPKLDPQPIPVAAPALPTIFVPVLEIPVTPATPSPVTARQVSEQPSVAQGPVGVQEGLPKATPARAAPVTLPAVVDASACAKPDYPKNALRNGDTGVVTLALLIGVDGRVAESKVEKSSGFRELDRAAQMGLGLCRFKPGSVDGVPNQSWTRMQYVWSLNE